MVSPVLVGWLPAKMQQNPCSLRVFSVFFPWNPSADRRPGSESRPVPASKSPCSTVIGPASNGTATGLDERPV